MGKKKISSLPQFLSECAGSKVWIGVDVHKRSYSVAVCREDGQIGSWRTSSDDDLIYQLVSFGMDIQVLVYESGPTGFGLARSCMQAGIPVMVAAPNRIIRPVSPRTKTDSLDCRKLAELARKDMVHSIGISTEQEEALRALQRRRHQLADSLRKVKQRIKGFILFHGIIEPSGLERWTLDSLRQLDALPLQPILKDVLGDYLEELRALKIKLAALEKKMVEHTAAVYNKKLSAVRSVPGVGRIVACSFLAELFRPGRFQRGEEVSAYLGLTPFARHSGDKTPAARIRLTGQTRLRSLLVEAAWIWKARDPGIQVFYYRMLRNTGVVQKAITAVAHKLAIVLWRLALEERPYRPA